MLKLDTILKTFNKTLKQLDQYMEQEGKKIDTNEQRMADLSADNFTRHQEVTRAAKARDKIADILGED